MSTQVLKLSAIASVTAAVGALSGAAILGTAQAQPSGHGTVHAARHHRHHARHRIPQHNRGDHDSDNNGGPSDGDGRV